MEIGIFHPLALPELCFLAMTFFLFSFRPVEFQLIFILLNVCQIRFKRFCGLR